jgi:ankyrin repeat protein
MLSMLLNAGVPLEDQYRGRTALLQAVRQQRTGLVRILLQARADVNIDRAGETALSTAVAAGHLTLVQLLADAGAQLTTTATLKCRGKKQKKVVQYLERLDAGGRAAKRRKIGSAEKEPKDETL